MTEEMQLRNSWVIVRRFETEKYFPGTMIEQPREQFFDDVRALVVNKGPGKWKRSDLQESMDLNVGDVVVLDGMFTTDKNMLPNGDYVVDVKSVECIVKVED